MFTHHGDIFIQNNLVYCDKTFSQRNFGGGSGLYLSEN